MHGHRHRRILLGQPDAAAVGTDLSWRGVLHGSAPGQFNSPGEDGIGRQDRPLLGHGRVHLIILPHRGRAPVTAPPGRGSGCGELPTTVGTVRQDVGVNPPGSAGPSGARSLGPEATQPQPGLPAGRPPPPGGSAQGRRAVRRPRPQTDTMLPSKITVTRVAAIRTRQLTSAAVRRVNAASRADGAGDSGLTGLIWTHALNVAGDALIAVSLAGTLFFAAAAGEQRSNVALYLLVTMAPFAVVAPIIGPALDRLQRGRRWALAATMGGRAVLAWIMASNYDNFALYPAAFGALVLSKSYGVLRGAVVPRVLPGDMTLVTANARLSIFGIITGGVFAGIGAGVAALLGFSWELGLTVVVFTAAGIVALRLPTHVDHSEGELPASVLIPGPTGVLTGRGRRSLGIRVVTALRGVATLRGLTGFLTIFSPFFMQGTIGGVEGTLALGAIAGAAGLGSFTGTAIGARARVSNPDVVVLVMTGIAAVACLIAAFAFSLGTMVAVALAAGVTNALGKHGLDAIIQRDVPESLRSSAFARSETLLQITWVFGGAVAISLPLIGWIAFTVAAALIVTATTLNVISSRKRRGKVPAPPGHVA